MGNIDIRKIFEEQASEVETKRALEILTQQETERDPGGTDMKDLATENYRLSIENRQLKKKYAKLDGEVTAYKDRPKSVLFPDGRRVLFQKPLCELKNVPIDETGYIEHLKSIGFVEVLEHDDR